ncbi:MAG: dienelactone hydrolase family protein [Pseudohongiellaceae bacterium]
MKNPAKSQPTKIDEYAKTTFAAKASTGHLITHDVYQRGFGPPVILIQELPGIGKAMLRLADKFVAEGFTVILPHLFGPIGRVSIAGNFTRVFCMRKEFNLFTANKNSPIVDWLKALCQFTRESNDVAGVGVIGMCLTGNFALSLMADDSVLAAVAAQPAMPIGKQAALDIAPETIEKAKNRIDRLAPVKAYRFEGDPLVKAKKFKCIHDRFNDEGKTRVEMTVIPGPGHSVLTLDFVDEAEHPTRLALDEILEYFHSQLDAS